MFKRMPGTTRDGPWLKTPKPGFNYSKRFPFKCHNLSVLSSDAGGHNVPLGVDTGDRIWGDGDTGEAATDASDVILGDNGRIDRRFLNTSSPPVFYQPWPVYKVDALYINHNFNNFGAW